MVSVGDQPSEVVIRVLKSLQLSGEVFGLFSGGIAVELRWRPVLRTPRCRGSGDAHSHPHPHRQLDLIDDRPLLLVADPGGVDAVSQLVFGPRRLVADKRGCKCSGTPVRSHWVMNHLRVLWNTIPGLSNPQSSRTLAKAFVTMFTDSA